MNKSIITNISVEEIIRMYNDGTSTIELAKIAGYKSAISIINILTKNNVIRRKYSPKNNRKRKIDESIFINIDSSDKAYLVGLLCSDGSIDKDGYGFQLRSKDIELLQYCKEILKSEHKICKVITFDKRSGKTFIGYNIHFCSKKMVNDLNKLGLTNNKSFTCKMPAIQDIYFWDFFRGLFDGDGCAIDGEDGRVKIKIIAAEPIAVKIKEVFLKNNLSDTKPTLIAEENNNKIYSIKQNSYKDILFIRDMMYQNANYKLERKYNILNTLKEYKRGSYQRKLC